MSKVSNAIDPHSFSSWRKLIHATARIRRLAEKIRLQKYNQHGKEGSLRPEELQQAELYWINQAQTTRLKMKTELSELEEEWRKL